MLQLAASLILTTLFLFSYTRLLPNLEIEHFSLFLLSCLVLGIVNFLIIPCILLLKLTPTKVTHFLFSFIINTLLLNVAIGLIDQFGSRSWTAALLGAFLFTLVRGIWDVIAPEDWKFNT
jgi:putative membrane protein